MTWNTWLSSLWYVQKTSLQRSQVRAEKSGGWDEQDVGGGRVLACGAGRNPELGTSSASSQTPSFLHIQCLSSQQGSGKSLYLHSSCPYSASFDGMVWEWIRPQQRWPLLSQDQLGMHGQPSQQMPETDTLYSWGDGSRQEVWLRDTCLVIGELLKVNLRELFFVIN